MILMIDNYDSFTYNLVQYLGELGADVVVHRNDKITLKDIEQLNPKKIVISPGPCTPEKAGISMEIARHFGGEIPLLGVCLGHQSIARAYGGEIIKAKKLMHGKTSMVTHDNKNLFRGLPNPFEATRYHSLVLKKNTISDQFEINATSDDGEIMGIRHKNLFIEGVQFHPESILTTSGKDLLANFLNMPKD
ncbi:MAG: aminodeoxychorismate/anthranilate synthase component II [Nitrospina sp.]|jgi:anthranilate synthase/aminodeoxychorismate synthase-like glutamine amidotransferase|nr:aminodeoxychorismate/anthranilate synthase component II [Nitrospina sp.]MBT6600531.1 aminodeoxychorismate/anthranilate synthase component II [Nitrospina sp.]